MNIGDFVICENPAWHWFEAGKPYEILESDGVGGIILVRDEDGEALEWSVRYFLRVTDLSELEKAIHGIA